MNFLANPVFVTRALIENRNPSTKVHVVKAMVFPVVRKQQLELDMEQQTGSK